ncbi:MAG: phosphoadenylyl-sulfate reductase [Mariprofundaceae bacterium]|nr:phosphoadenylyl-sulfate reductase [Mariprofundaceae bacterium]
MQDIIAQSLSVLQQAKEKHGERLVYPCSFGAESAVLLALIDQQQLNIPVITLDTGRLPQATHDIIAQVAAHYGIKITVFFPDHRDVESMVAKHGVNLFRDSLALRKQCCSVRKVQPLKRALAHYDAWITGRRAKQSATRATLDCVDTTDPVYGLIKYNPLAHWSWQQIMDFIKEHKLPHHALLDQHYSSIGCECCTRAITMGEDARAGRWWWEQGDVATECGLHVTSLRKPSEGEQGEGI